MGDTKERRIPTEIEALQNMKIFYINCGKNHSAVIDDNLDVFLWGSNKKGQLGLGLTTKFIYDPTILQIDEKFIKVKCGYNNTMLLSKGFEVYLSGVNEGNCVSIEPTLKVPIFIKVPDLIAVDQIFCTNFFTVLTKDHSIYVWGQSEMWQFSKPFLIDEFRNQCSNVSIGNDFIILLDFNFLLYSAGKNHKGQLGYENTIENAEFKCIEKLSSNPIKLISCGADFCLGISGINLKSQNLRTSEINSNIDNETEVDRKHKRLSNILSTKNQISQNANDDEDPSTPFFGNPKSKERSNFDENRARHASEGFEGPKLREPYQRLSDNNSNFVSKRPSWNSNLQEIKERDKEDENNKDMAVQAIYTQNNNSKCDKYLDFGRELIMLEKIEREYNKSITPKDFHSIYTYKIEEIRVTLVGSIVF